MYNICIFEFHCTDHETIAPCIFRFDRRWIPSICERIVRKIAKKKKVLNHCSSILTENYTILEWAICTRKFYEHDFYPRRAVHMLDIFLDIQSKREKKKKKERKKKRKKKIAIGIFQIKNIKLLMWRSFCDRDALIAFRDDLGRLIRDKLELVWSKSKVEHISILLAIVSRFAKIRVPFCFLPFLSSFYNNYK